MKRKAYKTFVHIIHETYDTIENHQERLDMVIHSLKGALNKSYIDFEEIVKYNKEVLIKNAKNTQQLIREGIKK